MKIHAEVWLAAASLHEAGAESFTPKQVVQEVFRLFGDDRAGVTLYTYSHANGSNKKAIAAVYNYILNTGDRRCRLARQGDTFHPTRQGLPLWPDQLEVDESYWPLWRKWVAWQRQESSAAAPAALLPPVEPTPAPIPSAEMHSRLSSYREAMMEHLLIGELMRRLWLRGETLEVCKPQVDSAGYDLILQSQGALRHVQLKTSFEGASTREVSVHIELARRHCGCVIWTRFDQETLVPVEFWWFGGAPGRSLPDLSEFKVARHAKANASGFKAERPMHRRVPQSRFTRVATVDELIQLLFGTGQAELPSSPTERVAAYAGSLTGFRLERSSAGNYDHMGATLTEAILQAGIDYRSLVVPRVKMLLEEYPQASTTTAFAHLLMKRPPEELLSFGGEKPQRIREIVSFFLAERVETEEDLRRWLGEPSHRTRLQSVPGVGPKTVDYLLILVGGDTVAVDRHLAQFLELAGVRASTYDERKQIIGEAAGLLGVDQAVLDHSIWLYMSNRAKGA